MNIPGSDETQADIPAVLAYFPAAHALHTVFPAALVYVPAAQGLHGEVARVPEPYWPGAHAFARRRNRLPFRSESRRLLLFLKGENGYLSSNANCGIPIVSIKSLVYLSFEFGFFTEYCLSLNGCGLKLVSCIWFVSPRYKPFGHKIPNDISIVRHGACKTKISLEFANKRNERNIMVKLKCTLCRTCGWFWANGKCHSDPGPVCITRMCV